MKLLTILCSVLALRSMAQTSNHFTVTPQHVYPGSTVSIAYKNKGTILEGQKNIRGVVYSYVNFKWRAADLLLKQNDTAWLATYKLPDSCALFVCFFETDSLTDRGGQFTYAWLPMDKNRQLLPGARYAWGKMRSPLFKHEQPFEVDSASYIGDDVVHMWFRNEATFRPESQPYIFRNAFRLYKKRNPNSSGDTIITKEVARILALPNLPETVYIDAIDVYANLLHDKAGADSLTAITIRHFPHGIAARDKAIMMQWRETDMTKKLQAFDQFIIDFPPAQFTGVNTFTSDLYYGKLFRTALYTPIIKDSNYAVFLKYLPVAPTEELSTFYHHMVEIPYEKKSMPLPVLMRLSDTIYNEIMRRPPNGIYSPLQWKALQLKQNAFVCFTHAQLLYENKQPQKALAIASQVNRLYNYKKGEFNDLYVHLLTATGKKQQVMPYLLAAARENALSTYMLDLLKKDYIAKKNKTGEGFDAWLNSLKSKEKMQAATAELNGDLVNMPIANFTLESAKGGMVDLSKLKGKIVVLDFWATWCGPCKAAMPGMQLVVNKYKSDTNVAFYFIATEETTPDYKQQINKFLADKQYSFEVLYDAYNEASKHLDKTYARYAHDHKSSGIPMKLIIDQQGRLRWVNHGYKGSPSALADEIAYIIDTLQKEKAGSAPPAAAAYNSENVYFYNSDSSIRFAGTLTLPANGIQKTVILVSGTGKQDRDGTMAGHKLFAAIAHELSGNHIAVLRIDDRGTGETTGRYEDATTEDFANDALVAVHYLQTKKALTGKTIGLLGHSEGGAAATIAAAADPAVQFIITLSGLNSTGLDALIQQNQQLVQAAAIPQRDKDRYNTINGLMFNTAYKYANDTAMETQLRQTYAVWKKHDDRQTDSLHIPYDHFRFPIESYVRQATGKWYRYHIHYNPAPFIARLRIPVLAIYGDKDVMVNATTSVANWKKFASPAEQGNITTQIFPGLNHLLQHCQTCTPAEYAQLKETIAPEVLEAIINWMKS